MGKSLIIAEKPSVATDISRALGGFTKHDDYYESEEYVLCSAVGHLLELTVPAEFEVKRGKWSFAHLPVIPDHFELAPLAKTEARLKLLVRLIKRKEVTSLVNACDAGREGELIFRYIVRHSQAKKPIQRLWLQSMTPAAIRDGFAGLREDREMLPLADAATCRSEADWLVGINGTRAMTAFNSKSGGFQLTTVGRVQTPTLAMVVDREERIRAFVSRPYWEVHGVFQVDAGEYAGRWFDEKAVRDKEDPDARVERIWDEARARAIALRCQGKPGVVSEERKPSTQTCPLLYDLTSLQREANGRFGLTARQTLGAAQALYEKHKVLTYPRTDSRALPEDYLAVVKETLAALFKGSYGKLAGEVLAQDWVRPNKRIFNNAKISDHFAIVPTPQAPKNLSEVEAKVYDLVTRRFMAIFYPAAEFMLTTRITRVEGEPFRSDGKVMVNAGWLAVYGKEVLGEEGEGPRLVPVKDGEPAQPESVRVVESKTKPPARLTEATLLTAMESAGKLIEDEELRAAMSAKGLGTPATRAAIIEGLIAESYLVREGRELVPTAKAGSVVALLKGLEVRELTSPEMTGDWEFKLKQIEAGELDRGEFMREIQEMTRHIVEQAKRHENDTIPGDFGTLAAPCPRCGGTVKGNYKKFQCQSCDFGFWRILAGRQFEVPEAEALVRDGEVGPLVGFRSRLGRPFTALIRLNEEFQPTFDFGNSSPQQEGEAPDFSDQEPLGNCPKCGSPVYEHGNSYACAKGAAGDGCDFRSGKVILQRPIARVEMETLLKEKKSPLLQRFTSKKGRPFSAYLVVEPTGKVGFEFEPRAPKAAAAAGAKKRKAAGES